MREEFSFPDIKKLVMDHLASSLKDAGLPGAPVPIYSNRPDNGAQVGQSWARSLASRWAWAPRSEWWYRRGWWDPRWRWGWA